MDFENQDLESFFSLVKEYIDNPNYNQGKVVKYLDPNRLLNDIDFKIPQNGEGVESLVRYAQKYFQHSVNTGSRQFLNQLYQGFNLPAFLGDIITVASNTSMYTYEVAPVATQIERELIQLMNSYAGYTNGDGIFVTGGSNANLIAMFSARNRIAPDFRSKGVDNSMKLKAFVNEQAHYSMDIAANLLGIGTGNVIKVKADDNGCMIPEELEKEIIQCIEKGELPFFVAATTGTTVMAAFDSIESIVPICKKYNVWLHADGAFGGSLILSSKFKYLFKGIEQTDSFTWDAHKLMNIPLMCSVILVREKGTLHTNIIDANTDYIYHGLDDVEDLGKKSIQCGRRADAVKLWFAWKCFGKKGYAKRIENAMNMAAYAEEVVHKTQQLELVAPRQSVNVCFRYRPNKEVNLNDFNLRVREVLRRSGKSMVNFAYIGSTLVIRLVVSNNEIEKSDIDRFFNLFIEVAQNLENDL
ncbi:MAG: pyridoxal phosphate-dependent decarboxylase family protein [Bacteroidales bacterium]